MIDPLLERLLCYALADAGYNIVTNMSVVLERYLAPPGDDEQPVTVLFGLGRVDPYHVDHIDRVRFIGGVARHVPLGVAARWQAGGQVRIQIVVDTISDASLHLLSMIQQHHTAWELVYAIWSQSDLPPRVMDFLTGLDDLYHHIHEYAALALPTTLALPVADLVHLVLTVYATCTTPVALLQWARSGTLPPESSDGTHECGT